MAWGNGDKNLNQDLKLHNGTIVKRIVVIVALVLGTIIVKNNMFAFSSPSHMHNEPIEGPPISLNKWHASWVVATTWCTLVNEAFNKPRL